MFKAFGPAKTLLYKAFGLFDAKGTLKTKWTLKGFKVHIPYIGKYSI